MFGKAAVAGCEVNSGSALVFSMNKTCGSTESAITLQKVWGSSSKTPSCTSDPPAELCATNTSF